MVFLVVVALGVGAALFLISERAAVVHAGYRVARLDTERVKQVEGNRRLDAQVARLKAPGAIVGKIKDFNLELAPPDKIIEDQIAREKEKAKEKAKAGEAAARPRRAP